jgi:predicted secreted protein
MHRGRRIAALVLAVVFAGLAAVGVASATSVKSGATVHLTRGDRFSVDLNPADNGSTGFHWKFVKKPRSAVLKFLSDRRSRDGKHEVIRFSARGTGTTSFKLEYVPPGRGGRAVKSFRLKVVVR